MHAEQQYHQVLVSRELGGAGLVALHLARHLTRNGRAPHVWIPGPGPAQAEATRLGLPCGTYDAESAASPSVFRAGLANWRLARALKPSGPGLVHVHSPGYYGALRRGLIRTGLTRVVHVQLEEGEPSLRWAFKSAPDLIIPCARFLVDLVRRALPEGSVGRTRIVAVPNAVDTERFTPGPKEQAKARVGAPAGRPLLLMLANLAPHKGQETAIRAVALLKQRGLEVTCWLAGIERHGEGAYTARLRTLIHEADVGDRVQLLGQRGDAPDLLRAADLFLLPSTNEGLPLSVLEAQATRVPVLAAPTAGIPEVVREGETGFLIPAADAEGYARRDVEHFPHPSQGHNSQAPPARADRAARSGPESPPRRVLPPVAQGRGHRRRQGDPGVQPSEPAPAAARGERGRCVPPGRAAVPGAGRGAGRRPGL
jgi:glycosyltransferase involved in cell wall biosynthesis